MIVCVNVIISLCVDSSQYRLFVVECDVLSPLSSLLCHENRDISNAAVDVIHDLFDADSELHNIAQQEQEQWHDIVTTTTHITD